jgi:ABC-type bacteriocin/lantibiotic exporter with double-glycine peptidase domain
MANWTGNNSTNQTHQWNNFIIYGAFEISVALTLLIGELFLVFGTYKASSKIHHNLMYAIIRAPMSFFDETPIGEVIQRFNQVSEFLLPFLFINF